MTVTAEAKSRMSRKKRAHAHCIITITAFIYCLKYRFDTAGWLVTIYLALWEELRCTFFTGRGNGESLTLGGV